MNSFLTIMALMLLAAVSWIVTYTLCMWVLKQSLWSPRLHLEDRFPPHRYRQINQVLATIVGLIVAGIVMLNCAPATIRSLQPASAGQSEQRQEKVRGPQKPDGGIDSPKVIARVEHVYPEDAKAQRIEGIVIVECTVTKDGRVRDPRVLKSPGLKSMERAAVLALQKWEFEPGKKDGVIVDMRMTLTFRFILD